MEIDLEHFLPYQLNQMANLISDDFARVYQQKYDLTIPQWRVLANLAQYGKSNAKDLCTQANMDKSTVSRAIKSLLQRGYIQAELNQQDKRVTQVMLNEQGNAIYKLIAHDAQNWEAQLAKKFTKQQQTQLLNLLKELKGAL
ncbi:MarR family transcriptional regulator [Pseudoalteromonas sp. S3785]|uniref:MarR family winged helix-turn-helix transcriptional regulator n=1 Tax=Pseudoalteromonas sp. S3785 TaxID=579545 RepID=UPI00110C08E4|nr:MarR family transcriptional regulator [Pseudoalteromonas sp. S3785]TMO72219.1 MarR family transcriptional regulator [Pseudoalteromonas sp. S3785]